MEFRITTSSYASHSHLKHLKFPLQSLVHVVLSILGFHPIQLNSNSYLLLLVFLVVAQSWEISLGFIDFFYFHICSIIVDQPNNFELNLRAGCKIFEEKPTCDKEWKSHPLLITGNWAAPEVDISLPVKFSKTFGMPTFIQQSRVDTVTKLMNSARRN